MDIALPATKTTGDLLRILRSIDGARQILVSRDLIEDRIRGGT
jgi:hypothetical protein